MMPGSGRSPGGGHGSPLQYSCLGESHAQRSLVGHSPWDLKELDTSEHLNTHTQILILVPNVSSEFETHISSYVSPVTPWPWIVHGYLSFIMSETEIKTLIPPTIPQSVLALPSWQIIHVFHPPMFCSTIHSVISAPLEHNSLPIPISNFCAISWTQPGLGISCRDKHPLIGGIESIYLMLGDLWEKKLQHWFSLGFQTDVQGVKTKTTWTLQKGG